MNKRNSIFFQINIFFISIFIIINTLIFIQFILDNNAYKMIQKKRYIAAIQLIIHARQNKIDEKTINEQLENLSLLSTPVELNFLRQNASKIIQDREEPLDIFYYEDKKYIHLRPPKPLVPLFDFIKENHPQGVLPPPPPPREFMDNENFKEMFNPIIFIDKSDERSFKYFWIFVLFGIDTLLLWFFFFLKKKLIPLYNLKREIIKFSKGDLSISTKNDGNDEISQVANEFDQAIVQLRQLKESRNLFLRNIMHELKTPITKGKLIADTLNFSQRKEILIRVFQRLEYLLGEFAKIEELTSGKIELIKNRYRVIDLLEHAMDILLIDKHQVKIYNKDFILDVDFDLFCIALKNLIDNAIKYNQNAQVEIFIEKESIRIRNQGEKLTKNIDEYLKPFNKEQKNTKEGLGLGLYITNNILKIHQLKLDYFYENGHHNFLITAS